MNCLTDQICFLSSFYDTLTQAASLIDFFGATIAGDDWKALTPVVERKLEMLLDIAARIVPPEHGTCGMPGTAETLDA